jgi:Arc/MetJ family transcription regulator
MKRMSLMLDTDLLEKARRVLGAKTYSATVNLALQEVVRIRKVQSVARFFGKGMWTGNLAEMRADRFPRRRKS